LLGIAIAILKTDQWRAWQPLLVRDEVSSSEERLGRFASPAEQRAAQETILELAKSPAVVTAAMLGLGRPANQPPTEAWPTPLQVEETARDQINLRAAKGVEYGTTEVVYLEATAESPERAVRFCELIRSELQQKLQQMRVDRALSVITELEQTRLIAARRLSEAQQRVREIEIQVGSDLAELQQLSDAKVGESPTQRRLTEIDRELAMAELDCKRLLQLQELLTQAGNDPQSLLIASTSTLESQPVLKRLKDGLIDAQLRSAQLAGKYRESHPLLQEARHAEAEIGLAIHEEVKAATISMQPILRLSDTRLAQLREEQRALQSKLANLADRRSSYALCLAEVQECTTQVHQVERSLAQTEASRQAATQTSLVVPVEVVQVPLKPVGPSRLTLALGCSIAGLAAGLAMVFLLAPSPMGSEFGRRVTDARAHRRSGQADLGPAISGRRAEEPVERLAPVEGTPREFPTRSDALPSLASVATPMIVPMPTGIGSMVEVPPTV
jgi:uncharacterized protein involved in exopolysaccharide biosynthesis